MFITFSRFQVKTINIRLHAQDTCTMPLLCLVRPIYLLEAFPVHLAPLLSYQYYHSYRWWCCLTCLYEPEQLVESGVAMGRVSYAPSESPQHLSRLTAPLTEFGLPAFIALYDHLLCYP